MTPPINPNSTLRSVQGQNELNQKVARLCGYTVEVFGIRKGFPNGVALVFKTDDEDEQGEILPDYCNDLNACAGFEALLLKDGMEFSYYVNLQLILEQRYRAGVGPFEYATARAEERCRAFVATMEGRSDPKRNEKRGQAPGSPESKSFLGANK